MHAPKKIFLPLIALSILVINSVSFSMDKPEEKDLAAQLKEALDKLQAEKKERSEEQKKNAEKNKQSEQETTKLKERLEYLDNHPRIGQTEFPNCPTGVADAWSEKIKSEKAYIDSKTYIQQWQRVDKALENIVYPILQSEFHVLLREQRQKWHKTLQEQNAERLEELQITNRAKDLELSTLDEDIKKQTKEINEINKKAKEAIDEAQLQGLNLDNLIRHCKHANGSDGACEQMEKMAEEIQLAQFQDAYKKRFGKEYVAPQTKPTSRK